ncbi:hypothetical protein NQ317_016777 [Molorchus minor]|uniref:Sodium channel protein Nach n=1 Tax=Molorchus minor TaxID=1323400 RepID=A0ABQ9IZ21_9CUCU|nr:hypothetical protein NQ317_016777 [Molorchus minor]
MFLRSLNFNSNDTDQDEVNFYMDLTKLSLDHIKSIIFKLANKCEDIFYDCLWKGLFSSAATGSFLYLPRTASATLSIPDIMRGTFLGSHRFIITREQLPGFNKFYIKETDLKWAMKFRVLFQDTYYPIYILNSDEIAGIDVRPQHLWDFSVEMILFSVKETYTTLDTAQLSIKQRRCAFPDEVKLKIEDVYSYTACTRQCRMDTAMELCGCVPFFYPEVAHYKHCEFKKFRCISQHIAEIKSVDKCSCYLGCGNTVYEVEKFEDAGTDDTKANGTMECQFVSWPMVRYKREVLFGWVDLLVSFGGIAGLFLGFSLLSGVEILYYFTVRACCMVIRERKELEKIRLEAASKPLPDYDLSLVPYFISDPLPGNGINEVAKHFYQNNLISANVSIHL